MSLPELQITFSLLVFLQAFLSPFQGSLIDRFGARTLISIGTLVAGSSWIPASYAQSEAALYLTYGVLGGIGTGIVYVGVVGLVVRWFPEKRGLAAGIAAALRMPAAAGIAVASSSRDRSPSQILRTPVFWLMFVMMTMMATSRLMVTSQMASSLPISA